MFDNLRENSGFIEEEPQEPVEVKQRKQRKPLRGLDKMTGMTAPQRFALAVMLLVVVILLGSMFLLISGKVAPSFAISF